MHSTRNTRSEQPTLSGASRRVTNTPPCQRPREQTPPLPWRSGCAQCPQTAAPQSLPQSRLHLTPQPQAASLEASAAPTEDWALGRVVQGAVGEGGSRGRARRRDDALRENRRWRLRRAQKRLHLDLGKDPGVVVGQWVEDGALAQRADVGDGKPLTDAGLVEDVHAREHHARIPGRKRGQADGTQILLLILIPVARARTWRAQSAYPSLAGGAGHVGKRWQRGEDEGCSSSGFALRLKLVGALLDGAAAPSPKHVRQPEQVGSDAQRRHSPSDQRDEIRGGQAGVFAARRSLPDNPPRIASLLVRPHRVSHHATLAGQTPSALRPIVVQRAPDSTLASNVRELPAWPAGAPAPRAVAVASACSAASVALAPLLHLSQRCATIRLARLHVPLLAAPLRTSFRALHPDSVDRGLSLHETVVLGTRTAFEATERGPALPIAPVFAPRNAIRADITGKNVERTLAAPEYHT
eukprot:3515442-Rhodomonas_salina.2